MGHSQLQTIERSILERGDMADALFKGDRYFLQMKNAYVVSSAPREQVTLTSEVEFISDGPLRVPSLNANEF